MTEVKQVYRCEVCGNIVMVMHAGVGQLVCCGQPMKLMRENTVDASKEKHVPVIERRTEGVVVRVGSAPHPMEAKHYIEWVELEADGALHIKFLKPGEKPEALFPVKAERLSAREYCNIHGLWKA
ncbi:MAG: desulfoferrodoxin [Thermoplasmata archaeon]